MEKRSLTSSLSELEFFKGISERLLDLLDGCASNKRLTAGGFVFREDGPADSFYIVRQGKIAIELHVPARHGVIVETLGPGEAFGWSWMVPPYRWHFDARAVEDSLVTAFDATCLRTKAESDHELGHELFRRFLAVAVSRLDATRLQLLDIYSADAAPPKGAHGS